MAKLSFALPEYDSAIIKLIGDIKKGFDNLDPLLGRIQTIHTVHGGTIRQVGDPEIVETEMQGHSANIVLKHDWIRNTDVEKFTETIFYFTEELMSQQKKQLFDLVGKTSDSVGNTVDAKDKNVWDALYEMVDKMEMRFNDDGSHNHQLFIPAKLRKKMEENPPSPEQAQRMEGLMDSKRQNFYATKRTRKLSR